MLSVSMLMTELILTRLFSVTIWYHFAFLAISVALFGTGVAALFLHLFQRRISPERTDEILSWASLGLGAVIIVSDFIILHVRQDFTSRQSFDLFSHATLQLLVLFCAATLPFLFGGFAISLAMTRYSRAVHSLYSWDLLGAGAGCLLVIPALEVLGAPVALVGVAALPSVAAILFSRGGTARHRRFAWVPVASILIVGLLGVTNPKTNLFSVRFAKGLRLADQQIAFNRWNAFSMVTVWKQDFMAWGLAPKYKGPMPNLNTWNVVIDICAITPMMQFNGDLNSMRFLLSDLTAFVYKARPEAPKNVCVIGAGGGKDVLTALTAGAKHVTGVEINPLVVGSVMQGEFLKYTGGVYTRPDVTIRIEDGRGFVRASKDKYDLVQLSMVDTSAATAAGAYVLSENTLYTVEAFRDYLSHLTPGGMLSVSWVTAPNLAGGQRLCMEAREALKSFNLDPAQCVVVVSGPKRDLPGLNQEKNIPVQYHSVIVKREPFTADEIARVRKGAEETGFVATYVPGTPPGKTDAVDDWIPAILATKDDAALREKMARWPLDVSAVTDDRPFFFYQNRFSDIWQMFKETKPAHLFGNGLFILSKITILATVMVGLFLIAPLFFGRKNLREGIGWPGWDVAYVGCLGLGFMFVEISMIQKFVPYLGRPTYTLAVVLFVILCAGGIGSRLFGAGSTATRFHRLVLVLTFLVFFIIGLWQSGIGRMIIGATIAWPIWSRALLTALMIAPLGLALGAPFPAGLSVVSERAGMRIPWLWAVNSATSVLGSVLATLVSIHLGISVTLWCGIGLYAAALLLAPAICKRTASTAVRSE